MGVAVLPPVALIGRSTRGILPDRMVRIACLGTEGSWSHTAALTLTASVAGVELVAALDVESAVHSVQSGALDAALLPIENTLAGSVTETLDLLADSQLAIQDEVIQKVEHRLLALEKVALSELRRVISHPQAILQCRGKLIRHPHITIENATDTATAARIVRERGDRTIAAIASPIAAKKNGLVVLDEPIVDRPENYTRFVLVGRAPLPGREALPKKTSLLFATLHAPGALVRALSPFAFRGINLLRLESRPVPGQPFEYRFYLDAGGDAAVEPLKAALAELEVSARAVKVLGTYPLATRVN